MPWIAWLDHDMGWWESAAVVASITIGAFAYVWRKHLRARFQHWRAKVKFYMEIEGYHKKMLEEIGVLASKLDLIGKELVKNSGHSLRDVVDRIERDQYRGAQWAKFFLTESPFGAWESDADGDCVWASDVLLRMAGASMSDLVGSNWANVIHPDDRGSVFREWNAAVKYERNYRQQYRLLNLTTQEPILIEARGKVVRDPDGKVAGFLGTIRPIDTEHRRRAHDR